MFTTTLQNKPQNAFTAALARTTVKNLQRRNFEAYYCPDKTAALQNALQFISKYMLVSWGDSLTLEQLGLLEAIKNGGYNYIDRDSCEDWEKRLELIRKAIFSDVYFTSANAISADGVIINIDRTGNRTSAMAFGPKNVVIIAGVNKIAPTYRQALARARNVAAPLNIQRRRFDGLNTPCKQGGVCYDCQSPDSICGFIMAARHGRSGTDGKPRIKLLIVNENLGY